MGASPLRVAHIDDDEDMLAMVRLALQSTAGYAVASCQSGEVALRDVPGFHPDVILVDALMPDMDGIQTLRALERRMDLSDVTVVFATGLDDPERLDQLRQVGAAIIRKPFDARTLASQLQRISHR